MTLALEDLSEWALARTRWHIEAREAQIFPADADWDVAFFMAGRGSGKTRSGAEDCSEFARTNSHARLALVGPTFADVRDTMIEGESGLLSVLPPSALRGGTVDTAWNRSMGELFFANGTLAKAFSSEKPDRLRGPQHHRAWVDEPASFRDAHQGDSLGTTWNNLMLGLRLGERPRVIVTGTPKRVRLVREILTRPRLHLVSGSTYDNLANLAPNFRETILSQYEGTRIGRQELLGELLEDVDGALWSEALIDEERILDTSLIDMLGYACRSVVAIDPAVTSGEDSDDTGIVAAARLDTCPVCPDARVPHAVVLADRTGKYSPEAWASTAVRLSEQVEADRIVGEVNNGGDLVEFTLRAYDRDVSYKAVRASRGKRPRAEPIAALYEQRRVHHLGHLPELEEQMTSWTRDSDESPDRMDALVWALTELMLSDERKPMRFRGAA